MSFDVERWRRCFPALARRLDGRSVVYFDGPAGSQVPHQVVDAVGRYLLETNANSGGHFATSMESDALLQRAHAAVAGFLGADDPDCVVFGPNMTTLTGALARSLGQTWSAGDEIVVTRLEHDANYTPWVQAAAAAGARVRQVDVRPDDCTLDLDGLDSRLGPRTRLVAVGAASNCVGTVNPVARIAERAHAVGARVFVDAVHYAPHLPIDVAGWDCDFVVCSAYKFFGPHVGILWGRRELLETLATDRLRPVPDRPPHRFMPGTGNHEGIAGTVAAIDYLAEVGYEAIEAYERVLIGELVQGLVQLPGVRVWGITDPRRIAERVPTVAFTHATRTASEVARFLAERGIYVWHGNFYALPLTERLGLEPEGMVRIGLLHYNTREEIQRLLAALDELT